MKATLCVDVNDADDVAAVERWRQTWGTQLVFGAENQGCGCCVDIWDVEAPEEAIKQLPLSVVSSNVPFRNDRHKTLVRRMADAKGCLVVALMLAAGLGLLLLASVHMIPYQDPTPELRAKYARDVATARTLGLAGVMVFCGGLLASAVICIRWAKRRIAETKNKRTKHDDP